jgi:hypothetical protein
MCGIFWTLLDICGWSSLLDTSWFSRLYYAKSKSYEWSRSVIIAVTQSSTLELMLKFEYFFLTDV